MRSIKTIFITAILLFANLFSLAQLQGRSRIDSLLKVFNTDRYKKDDTSKVMLLREISEAYEEPNLDSSILYANMALKLAEKLNYEYGQARCLERLGRDYYGQYNTALDYYFRSLKIFEQINDGARIANVLHAVAGVYYNAEKYTEALDYFNQAKKQFERIQDKDGVARSDHSIAATYVNLEDFHKALEYQTRAMQYFKETGEQGRLASAWINMGDCYIRLRDYNRALVFGYASVRLARLMGEDRLLYVEALSDLGYMHFVIASDSISNIFSDSLLPTGRNANLAKAIQYYNEALVRAEKLPNYTPSYIFLRLADALAASGKSDEALTFYKRYMKVKDSMLSHDMQIKIAAEETKREADLKEKQIQINKQATLQERNERTMFAGGVLLLLAVIVGVYINYRNQRKTNRLQETMLRQKELLMKEIHHRVKNNLQVISTLLDLQLGGITDTGTKDAITESNTRLKAISLIHQQLYQEEHITNIEFAAFATALHTQVSAVFNKTGWQVVFRNDIPHTLLDIDTSVPLGLVLNELITNSYKYAFGNTGGSISVRSEKTDSGYRLIYKDSGPGLPAGTNVHGIKSLGMQLINGLSMQLAGAFRYIKETNEFVISFKDMAGRKMVD